MPKVSVYLPDELYRAVREQQLPVSAITQRALTEALRVERNRAWVERARTRRARVTRPLDTLAALDAAREELGA